MSCIILIYLPKCEVYAFISQNVNLLAQLLNERYVEFRNSLDGIHFSGNVFVVADCVGSIILYDLLVSSNSSLKRVSYIPERALCSRAFGLLASPSLQLSGMQSRG